ncbi:unnamed protein product, partial [Ectocarpus sp. 12 AP-2014]
DNTRSEARKHVCRYLPLLNYLVQKPYREWRRDEAPPRATSKAPLLHKQVGGAERARYVSGFPSTRCSQNHHFWCWRNLSFESIKPWNRSRRGAISPPLAVKSSSRYPGFG